MFPYPRSGPFAQIGQITVVELHRMIKAGEFDTAEKERTELVEGWIIPKARQSPGHGYVRMQLADWFRKRTLPDGWMYAQVAAVVTSDSHLEPDGQLVRDAWMVRPGRFPLCDESAVLIEVSDVSLDFDQTVKLRVYARASIPEYWIVNLIDRQVEVYTNPSSPSDADPQYASRTDYTSGQQVPVTIAGQILGSIAVDAILPL